LYTGNVVGSDRTWSLRTSGVVPVPSVAMPVKHCPTNSENRRVQSASYPGPVVFLPPNPPAPASASVLYTGNVVGSVRTWSLRTSGVVPVPSVAMPVKHCQPIHRYQGLQTRSIVRSRPGNGVATDLPLRGELPRCWLGPNMVVADLRGCPRAFCGDAGQALPGV
jgi:hypothetical protein